MKMTWGDTMLVTVTGITIVFTVLIVLVFVMYLFGKVASSRGNKEQKSTDKPAPTKQKAAPPPAALSASSGDEDELIAVIAAAVQSLGESSGKRYAVRSIRPSGARSAWAAAGIYENTRPF